MALSLSIIARDASLRKRLNRAVREHRLLLHTVIEASEFAQAARLLREHRPHVVLLEMEPGRRAGLDLLEAMAPDQPATVLFAGDTSCALEVIRFRPVDLLPKNVDDARLEQAVTAAVELALSTRRTVDAHVMRGMMLSERQVALKLPNGMAVLHVDDIIYLKSNDDATEIHLRHQPRVVVSRRLKELEARLAPEGFLRIHQSYVVNRRHVTGYLRKDGSHAVVLSNEQRLPVSRERKDGLLKGWTML